MNMFTVYDSKAEAYLNPFVMKSRGEAVRAFTTTSNDPQSNICQYPADFTLFEIGTWDEMSGRIEMSDAAVNLGTAIEYQRKDD